MGIGIWGYSSGGFWGRCLNPYKITKQFFIGMTKKS